MPEWLENNVDRLVKTWADPWDERKENDLCDRFVRHALRKRGKRGGILTMAASSAAFAWVLWMIYSVPQAPSSPQGRKPAQEDGPRHHVVRSGDTFPALAKRYLGDESHWRLLLEANPDVDPFQLAKGRRLVIPPVPRPGTTTHVVRPGETLATIARKYYGAASLWKQILEENPGIDPFTLKVGQALRIPPLKIGRALLPPWKTTLEDPPIKDLDIQSLIDRAKDGETIRIPFGLYVFRKGLVIRNRKNLTLEFAKGAKVRVDDVNVDVVSIDSSEGISVVNGSFRHQKPLSTYECHGSVIRIIKSKNISVRNCELNGCGAVGIDCRKSEKVTVEFCHMHHNSFSAIYLQDGKDFLIRGNVIEDNANTLDAHRVSGLQISDNLIRRNGGYWRPRVATPGIEK